MLLNIPFDFNCFSITHRKYSKNKHSKNKYKAQKQAFENISNSFYNAWNMQTDRRTDRHTERKTLKCLSTVVKMFLTGRQTNRQTERQTPAHGTRPSATTLSLQMHWTVMNPPGYLSQMPMPLWQGAAHWSRWSASVLFRLSLQNDYI